MNGDLMFPGVEGMTAGLMAYTLVDVGGGEADDEMHTADGYGSRPIDGHIELVG